MTRERFTLYGDFGMARKKAAKVVVTNIQFERGVGNLFGALYGLSTAQRV